MAIIKLKNGFESGTSVALINWEDGFPVINWIKNTGSCTYQNDPLVDEEIEVTGSHLVRYYAQHQADHVTIALVGTTPPFPAGHHISHTRVGVEMLEPVLIKTWADWITAVACGHTINQITSTDWLPIRFDWGAQETAAYYRLNPDTGEAELVPSVGEHTPYLDKRGELQWN